MLLINQKGQNIIPYLKECAVKGREPDIQANPFNFINSIIGISTRQVGTEQGGHPSSRQDGSETLSLRRNGTRLLKHAVHPAGQVHKVFETDRGKHKSLIMTVSWEESELKSFIRPCEVSRPKC